MTASRAIDFLDQATREVLETMFFVFPDPIPGPDQLTCPAGEAPALCCLIEFKGPTAGRLEAYYNQALSRTLAANFLGQSEEEVPEALILDTAKELTNMICGRFLALLEPKRTILMGLPRSEICQAKDPGCLFGGEGETLVMQAEEGLVAFRLVLEGVA